MARPSKPADLNLTRERVCAEALALVDEEGLDALSMRRLGARLGCEAMSLYRHVRDKADLLDALQAAVLGDLAVEHRAGDWRALVEGMARGFRKTLLLHPNVVPLFATRPINAPEALAPIARVWTVLGQAGFTMRDAEKVIITVGVFTLGFVLAETQGRPPEHPGSPRMAGSPEFKFGLDALLDGIEMKHGPKKKATVS
jgi:TetR/AcrR family transcriptional regulator, tetracycline repressor protein